MLKLIPLGGLGEVGRNMLVVEAGNERVLVDCGVSFPRADQLGVDLVIPDISYLRQAPEALKGIVLTHAHEDHVGGLTTLLREFDAPVFGTPYTLGAARHRLEEAELKADLQQIAPRNRFRVGPFEFEPIRVTHSVPDAVGLIIRSEFGTVVHTGDFKLDGMPIDGQLTDVERLSELGEEGVDVLLSDSTNAEVPGWSGSERVVEKAFERHCAGAPARIVIAMFGSHLHRVSHALGLAQRLGRRVVLLGRSLQRNVDLAREAQILTVPAGLLVHPDDAAAVPRSQLLILCTGAQGEVRSGLSNLASSEAGPIRIAAGDLVLFSARAIPGNEPAITALVNGLLAKGARVITTSHDPDIHVSGHASRDEQRKVLQVTKPKHLVPIHGELRHLLAHASLGAEANIPSHVVTDGDVLGVQGGVVSALSRVPSGQRLIRRDALGEVTEATLHERKLLAESGLVTVVVAMELHGDRIVLGPTTHGQALSSAETSVLSLAADGAKLALEELPRSQRGDDERVREALLRGTRRVFKQLLGTRPVVSPIVVRVPNRPGS